MDPQTIKKSITIAGRVTTRAYDKVKLERARAESARIKGYELADLKPLIEEAFGVLGLEGGSPFKQASEWMKGLVSERPEIFKSGVPLLWIRTQSAQDTLTRLALDHLGSNSLEISQEEADFYRSFESEASEDEPRFDVEDVMDEALRFVLASLDRHLSAGQRVQLAHLTSRLEKISADTQNLRPVPSKIVRDALDKALEAELEDLLTALDLDESGKLEAAERFADRIRTGELQDASPDLKADALAWSARLLVSRNDPATVQALLVAAASISRTDYVRVADAMCAVGEPWEQVLGKLQPLDSAALRGGAVRLRMRRGDPAEALEWFADTGWDEGELDPDGRAALMNTRLKALDWQGLRAGADKLDELDFSKHPDLLHVSAIGLVAPTLPADVRRVLLEGVPFESAGIPLAGDATSVRDRRRAATLFARAAASAATRRGPEFARRWRAMELWLKLRDAEEATDATEKVARGLSNADDALSLVPLALDFNVPVDREAVTKAISQSHARNPKGSIEAARARIALIATDNSPQRIASELAQYEDELSRHLDRAGLIFMRAAALAEFDKPAAAAAIADARAVQLGSEQLERLAAELEATLDTGGVSARQFDIATASTPALSVEFARLARDGPGDRFLEVGRALLSTTRSVQIAERLVARLESLGRTDDVDEILANDAAELIEASAALRASRAWSSFRQGNLDAAEADLRHLERVRENTSDRILRQNVSLVSGRWDELNTLVESEWAKAGTRSAVDLLAAAQLAAAIGHNRRDALTDLAAERGADDPNILAECYLIAVQSGRDEDPAVSFWLSEAARLSGSDGPIRPMQLGDLVASIPERRRLLEETAVQYRRGEIPAFMVSETRRRPLLEIQLVTMLKNRQLRDARMRRAVTLYSGARRRKLKSETPKAVAFDGASLLTLASLDRLKDAFAFFEQVILPHSMLSWLFHESLNLRFHQPSLVEHAKWLRRKLASGELRIADDSVASPERVDKVGLQLAGITEVLERERANGKLAYIVHPFPLTSPGSLGAEPISGDGVDGLFVSSHAIVAGSLGELDSDELKRAKDYLKLAERPWPDEKPPTLGDTIFLDQPAIDHLRGAGVLDGVLRAYSEIYVSKRLAAEADALIESETAAAEVQAIVARIRECLATALASGKARLAPAILDEGIGNHPNVASLSVPGAGVIVSDERFVNRYTQMNREDESIPIWTSFDVLAAMGLSQDTQLRSRTWLRRAGVVFMPVTADELDQMLREAVIDASGRLVENAELKAVRENIRLCQAEAVLRLPTEAPWIEELDQALIATMRRQWDGSTQPEIARARCDWLLSIADPRSWAEAIEGPTSETLAKFGLAGTLSRMLIIYSDVENPDLADWLKSHVTALESDFPQEYAALIEDLRATTREAASTKLEGRLAEYDSSDVAMVVIGALPTFMQLLVAADLDFHDDFNLSISGTIILGGGIASFDRNALHTEAAAVLSNAEERRIVDNEGGNWTLTILDPATSMVRMTRDDGNWRDANFFSIDPEHERRLAGFEFAIAGTGMGAEETERWRERLSTGPLPSDRTGYLERDLLATPGRISSALRGQAGERDVSISQLAPTDRRYLDRLVGAGQSDTIEDYATTVTTPFQKGLLERGDEGVRAATQMGGHRLYSKALTEGVADAGLVKLAEWAIEAADPFAMVQIVEAALARETRSVELEEALLDLVGRVRALIETDGAIEVLSGLFVLMDGELGASAFAPDLPPFVRRSMSLASAALVYRVVGKGMPGKDFNEWAQNSRGYQFMLRTLLDMRQEPRWEADLAEPDQFRQELIGRLVNAAAVAEPALEGPLRSALLGEEDSILAMSTLGRAFAGPLEGASTGPIVTNDEIEASIDAGLAEARATKMGLVGLINTRRLGVVAKERVQALVELLERSNYLIDGADDDLMRQVILPGLAGISAVSRSVSLANAIRIVARRIRPTDPTALQLVLELRVAVVAAAAAADIPAWSRFIGDWALELAEVASGGEPARTLLDELIALCGLEPCLWMVLGRAIATLRLALNA